MSPRRFPGPWLALLLAVSARPDASYVPENRDRQPGPRALAAAGRADPGDFLDRFARSWVKGLSGDLVFVSRPGVFFTMRAYPRNHGSIWAYDSEIPLFFYGPGQVRPGRHTDPEARSYDIPATLAAMVGIDPPPGSTGKAHLRIQAARRSAPRALLVVVLDQVGSLDLERFADRLPNLARWRARGADFTPVKIDSMPTYTIVSHSGISTGAPPYLHGVIHNVLPDAGRRTFRTAFRPPPGKLSAGDLRLPTFADVLDLHFDNRSVVLTQIYADYAALAVTGHGADHPGGDKDLVVWYDTYQGRPTTEEGLFALPGTLRGRSTEGLIRSRGGTWDGEGKGSTTVDPKLFYKVTRTPWFARWEADNVLEAMIREKVGKDDVPDLVSVNLKSTDALGHHEGHDHPGYLACLQEVDRFLGAVEHLLDRQAGPGRWVGVVTADHGMVPDDGLARYYDDLVRWLGERIDALGNRDGRHPVAGAEAYQLLLDPTRLAEEGIGVERIRDLLLEDPHVLHAWTGDQVRQRAYELGFVDRDGEPRRPERRPPAPPEGRVPVQP